MPKATTSQNSFNNGEISPLALGRFDIAKYANSLKTLENFILYQLGGAMFRPGTVYVANVKDSSKTVRIIPFQYSTLASYIIEMGPLYMRFIINNGQLVKGSASAWQTSHGYVVGDYVSESAKIYYCIKAHTSGDNSGGNTFADNLAAGDWTEQSIYELPTPYAEADLFDIQFAQSSDVMYLVHPNYAPRKLSRTDSTTFNLAAVDFKRGPFLDKNVTSTTITASAKTGTVTLTASANIFDTTSPTSKHIGSLWRIDSSVDAADWVTSTGYVVGDYVTANGAIYMCISNHTSGTFATDLIANKWVVRDGVGAVVKITAVATATSATAVVQTEPDGSVGNIGGTGAYTQWYEGAFSNYRGYPACVGFHEQRLYYAATVAEPQKFWGSVIGAYDDFGIGQITDEDALSFQIAANDANSIRWISSGPQGLALGTSGGTYSATSGTSNATITPTNIAVKLNASPGAANFQPKRVSSYVYFIQRNLFNLRELYYDYLKDTQIANDMNLLADHMLRDGDGAVDFDVQQSPNPRMWIVRDDGQLTIVSRNPEQDVVGWSRIIAGSDSTGPGFFKSIAITQTDGGDDVEWVVVQRRIGGDDVQYIEYFTPESFTNDWDPVRVDASTTVDEPITITNIELI